MEKIADQVEDAVHHNGAVLCGGKVHTANDVDGYFYEPTVISGANDNMLITTKKHSDRLLLFLHLSRKKKSLKEQTMKIYGLATYCFTKDLGRGLRMMRELEYGIVGINDPTPIVIQAPFGGVKESDMGEEGGKYGLDEYLIEKYVSVDMG